MKAIPFFLAAPLLVALLAPFAVEQQFFRYPYALLIGTIPVVFIFTLLVALPMYFALPSAGRANLVLVLCISFTAGALSFFLFSFGGRGTFSEVNQVVLVQDGAFTAAGWRNVLSQSAWMGTLSLPGGLLFWLGVRVQAHARSSRQHEA